MDEFMIFRTFLKIDRKFLLLSFELGNSFLSCYSNSCGERPVEEEQRKMNDFVSNKIEEIHSFVELFASAIAKMKYILSLSSQNAIDFDVRPNHTKKTVFPFALFSSRPIRRCVKTSALVHLHNRVYCLPTDRVCVCSVHTTAVVHAHTLDFGEFYVSCERIALSTPQPYSATIR